jgi:hypothetical protein
MDILGADIALGGDIKNVVRREDMIWPEVVLMRDIHGEASVTNLEVLGEEDRDEYQELERMRTRYGKRFVRVFGRSVTTLPYQPPAGIPRWDDMVEVQIRQRRPQANPAYVQSEAERRNRALASMGKADPPKPRPETEPRPDPQPDEEDEDEDEESEDDIAAKTVSSRRRGKVANLPPPTLET